MIYGRKEFNNKVVQITNSKKGTGTYVGSGAQAQYRQYTEHRNATIRVERKADLDPLNSFIVQAV